MGRKIICHCEDIDAEEIYSALAQGFGDLETLRRYTGIGTGKCQGKCCLIQTLRVLASLRERNDLSQRAPGLTGDPRRIRLPTIRPPVLPLRIDDIIEASAQSGEPLESAPGPASDPRDEEEGHP